MPGLRHLLSALLLAGAMLPLGVRAGDASTAAPAGSEGHLESPLITVRDNGTQVPLDLTFKDDAGKTVKLGDYFNQGKPVLLGIIYYRCPGLCSPFMNEVTRTAQYMKLRAPDQYKVVIVSMDPSETPEVAAAKKANYLDVMGSHAGADGWHLLTSPDNQVRKLADAVGFGYKKDEETGQFQHGTALYVLMPSGKISRTLANVRFFDAQEVNDSLINAADGKVGTNIFFSLAQTCGFVSFNHKTGKYERQASAIMRVGGGLTILAIGLTIGTFLYRDGRRRRRHAGAV